MSGYFIQTQSGKQGPFDRNQLAKLVKAGKLPRDFDVEDASSGLLISVGDLVPSRAAAPPPPPPAPEPTGPDLVFEDAELSPSEFAPSLRKANKGARKRGDAAALRRGRTAEPERAAPAVRPRPATGRQANRPVRSAPSRGGARKRATAGGRGGGHDDGGRSSRYYRKKSSPAPIIVACVLVLGLGVGGYFFWDDINPWGSPFEGTWVLSAEETTFSRKGMTQEQEKLAKGLFAAFMKLKLVFKGDQVTWYVNDVEQQQGEFQYTTLERFRYRLKDSAGKVVDITVRGDRMSFTEDGNILVLVRQ